MVEDKETGDLFPMAFFFLVKLLPELYVLLSKIPVTILLLAVDSWLTLGIGYV